MQSTIKVLVRIRPNGAVSALASSSSQLSEESGLVINQDGDGKSISLNRDKKGVSDFTFSEGAVLAPDCSQSQCYSNCNLTYDVIEGINCCIMAYGQTGSGKTHSMYGKGWDAAAAAAGVSSSIDEASESSALEGTEIDSSDLGVVPRSIADLFQALDTRASERNHV